MNIQLQVLIFAAIALVAISYFILKSRKTKDADVVDIKDFAENILEPLISYSIYTVDSSTMQRFVNQAHDDFPNNYGILRHQYIEIDWNVINADWISIEGVGYVQSVGKMAFYPQGNTVYKISAKNKDYEISQEIFVRVFPVKIKDELFSKIPKIKFNTELLVPKIKYKA